MKKILILSLGLALCVCVSLMAGCSGKLSEEKINVIREQEQKLDEIYRNIDFLKGGIDNSVFEISQQSENKSDDIYLNHMTKCMTEIEEYKKYIDNLSMSEIKSYYEYFVKENKITQEIADDYYNHIEFKCSYIDRIYNYYKDIVEYTKDDKLDDTEIKDINIIKDSVFNPNSTDNKFKESLDEVCLISSEEFYKLRENDSNKFDYLEYMDWILNE